MSETRVVHVNDEVPGAVYIGRAVPRKRLAASPFANPYVIGKDGSRADVLAKYRVTEIGHRMRDAEWIERVIALRGKPLACFCRHAGEAITAENMCHGDLLAEVLSVCTDDELRAMAEGAE